MTKVKFECDGCHQLFDDQEGWLSIQRRTTSLDVAVHNKQCALDVVNAEAD